MGQYLLNILTWLFDIGFNVVILGGSPYETVSSRVGKQRPARWSCVLCRMLDYVFGPHHCDTARAEDYGKTLRPWWHFKGRK